MSQKEGISEIINETRNALRKSDIITVGKSKKPKKKKVKSKKSTIKKKKETNTEKKKNILGDAIADINREIANIAVQKKKLNEQIGNADKGLELSRAAERKLQQKIARLLEQEASLREKKKEISMEEEKLSEKMSKIQKVKFELTEL